MSQPTPEEIAEGLSERMQSALRRHDRKWLTVPACTRSTLKALERRGLTENGSACLTDLGIAVADVLAKRGAR